MLASTTPSVFPRLPRRRTIGLTGLVTSPGHGPWRRAVRRHTPPGRSTVDIAAEGEAGFKPMFHD